MKGITRKKKRTGRSKPKYQTKKNAFMIFEAMRNGSSLREVCRSNEWPLTTVYDWLNREYAEQYADAQARRADYYFDEMLEIADETPPDKDAIAAARLRIDTRKWVMSRMNPKKYGEKVDVAMSGGTKVTHDGEVKLTPNDMAIQRIDEIISKAIGSGQIGRVENAGEN